MNQNNSGPGLEDVILGISENRRSTKWSNSELLTRIIWELFQGPLFAWTPRPFWRWRSHVLRVFGAKVGSDVRIHPTVRVAIPWNLEIGDSVGIGDRVNLYSLGKIRIGSASTISQNAHLCAGSHEFRDTRMKLLKLPIQIGRSVWICADAFIGPDVIVDDYVVVGARAVVVRSLAKGVIAAGNPARVVGKR